jgi:hypothetical protein
MNFWEKTKDKFNQGKELMENSVEGNYTQKYSKKDAETFANDMKHEVRADMLRLKISSEAPLDYLVGDEKPQYLLSGFDLDIDGNDEGSQSKLFVTDNKIVMMALSITGKKSQYTVFFTDIIGLSVQRRARSNIRIQTAGHSYKISVAMSTNELADEVINYIRNRKREININSTESEQENAIDKLEKLADLQDRGAISEEEFNQKKQNLMDEI